MGGSRFFFSPRNILNEGNIKSKYIYTFSLGGIWYI